jgi:hypothetical protein
MGLFDGLGLHGWFDENPDRDDSDLTPRERRALFEENAKGKDHGRKVIADRAREAEKSALEKWLDL